MVEILDLQALRRIEERLTKARGGVPPSPKPRPLPPASEKELVGPRWPKFAKPKAIKKRRRVVAKDKLEQYIDAQNSRASF